MRIVKFDPAQHYDAMCSIWLSHGWFSCPLNALPRTGLVAEDEHGAFIAYMGLYIDEGTIAFIDWALADPSRDNRGEALREIFKELKKVAISKGCSYLYSFTKNKKWGSKMQSYGMLVAEEGATSYVMGLTSDDTAFIRD